MITNTSYPDIKQKKVRDFSIPSIGLGTHELLDKTCRQAVIEAIEIGYRHIDTAQSYNNEFEIGKAIKDVNIPRDELFLTDKVWFDKLKSSQLTNSFQESLDKLQTDYIDLLLIHWPPGHDQELINEALYTMRELQRNGKIRKIGVSNFTPKLMMEALTHEDIIANQVEYHPFLDQSGLLELAGIFNFMLIAYAPLAQGKILNNEILVRIGENYDKSEAQVVLRWLIQQYNVIAIPRSSNSEHMKSNINIFDFELSDTEMKRIAGLADGTRLIDPDFAPDWDEEYTIASYEDRRSEKE